MVWRSLSPHHSPKPSWIKLRFVSRHQPHFPFSDKEPELSEPAGLSPDFCSCCVEQISSSSSTAAPVNTGVKIPTCKFSMKEKFLTSPADLFRVFLNQEVRCLCSGLWLSCVHYCSLWTKCGSGREHKALWSSTDLVLQTQVNICSVQTQKLSHYVSNHSLIILRMTHCAHINT